MKIYNFQVSLAFDFTFTSRIQIKFEEKARRIQIKFEEEVRKLIITSQNCSTGEKRIFGTFLHRYILIASEHKMKIKPILTNDFQFEEKTCSNITSGVS